jgi:hypothetical protein
MANNGAKPWAKVNVNGFEVEIFMMERKTESYFCSYVTLPGSQIMNDSYLGYPTYREKDEIGFDTAHTRNIKMSPSEKLMDAINQAENAIKKYKEVTNDSSLY